MPVSKQMPKKGQATCLMIGVLQMSAIPPQTYLDLFAGGQDREERVGWHAQLLPTDPSTGLV